MSVSEVWLNYCFCFINNYSLREILKKGWSIYYYYFYYFNGQNWKYFSHPEIEGIWLLNTLILLYCFKDSKSTAGICYSILGMNIKRENKYDTFSNYKTAQNFANVTHANTTSGQFHIPNTASAPHLYLLFHKKKFSLPILAGSSGGNNCIVLSHMIILALTSSHTCTDTLYTNTQDIYTSHKVLYTHVHTHTSHL